VIESITSKIERMRLMTASFRNAPTFEHRTCHAASPAIPLGKAAIRALPPGELVAEPGSDDERAASERRR
jgi:hypothetical protein